MKRWILILLLAGMAIWAVMNQTGNEKEAAGEKLAASDVRIGTNEGEAAPHFALQTLDGQKVKLTDYRGKKVLLNFWASWCGPCKAEMPEMQTFYEETKGTDVAVLAINVTSSEKSMDDVKAFVQANGYTFPVLLDSEGRANGAYQTISIPTSYFLDEKGIVRVKHIGPMSAADMREYIKRIK
ncbi:TlpA disulfide reductase family protein [Ectobacillus ponti]|uniref:TlpA family protein disulfide reductase n=1 Tax=Ectobacillus ponti TaxID=2961894 RepID=A0AA42BQ52_9BACI|nr:TlpA disulfide reductase family protein [Ectobacillus ponti]MCP8969492.1 TlpA family protein disulfide reductase [Ectobacillus ponti]